jgi:hypothetical protein
LSPSWSATWSCDTRFGIGNSTTAAAFLAQETVDHVFWECPRYAKHRWGSSRCGTAASSLLRSCQRVLGAPCRFEELDAWRSSQAASPWVPPQWKAKELYKDASGRQPKDPEVRIVGWAIRAEMATLGSP